MRFNWKVVLFTFIALAAFTVISFLLESAKNSDLLIPYYNLIFNLSSYYLWILLSWIIILGFIVGTYAPKTAIADTFITGSLVLILIFASIIFEVVSNAFSYSHLWSLFDPALILIYLLVLGAFIGTKVKIPGKFFHQALFEHTEKSPHWPRILVVVLVGLIGFLGGVVALYPLIKEQTDEIQVYRDLTSTAAIKISDQYDQNSLKLVTNQNDRYTNTLLGISFDLPLSWYSYPASNTYIQSLAFKGQYAGLLDLTGTKETSTDQKPGDYHVSILVSRQDKAETLADVLKAEGRDPAKMTKTKIGRLDALSITYTSNQNPQTIAKSYFVKKGSLVFVFTSFSPKEGDPQFEEFQKLVDSVKFTD